MTRFGAWLLLLLGGCVAQLGAVAGTSLHANAGEETSAHFAWSGHASGAVELARVHAGLEVEGRAEHKLGDLFTSGFEFGYALVDPSVAPVGLVPHFDFGLPLGWTGAPGFYAGVTLALPIKLQASSSVAERNRNFRFLGSAPELVPFLRYRYYDLGTHSVSGVSGELHDLSVGLAIQARFATDLL